MEFEGRIQRVLPVRSGTSKNGNEWKTLPFVFEYFERPDDRWSDKVLLETFDTNIMAQIGHYLKKGPDGKAVIENDEHVLLCEVKCRVGFGHNVDTGKRQDGTTFTVNRIRMYKFEITNGLGQQPAGQPADIVAQQPAQQMQQPAYQQPAAPVYQQPAEPD